MMFRRRKTRVAPQVDRYIHRRYEDMAVCIQVDIASNRGLLCYYTAWLDQIMEKFNLPEEYRLRHSLVATDSHGRHIGCSGAVQNTLVYYNPVTPEIHRLQSREAKRKSILSDRFRDNKMYTEKSRSLDEKVHPSLVMKASSAKQTLRSSSVKVEWLESAKVTLKETRDAETCSEHSELSNTAMKSDLTPLTCHSHIHHMPGGSSCKTGHASEADHGDAKVTPSALTVSNSRPQSADSYYIRIDEAFRKHRENASKLAELNGDIEIEQHKDEGIGEGLQHQKTHTTAELDNNDQSTTTRKSKFCTIL